MHSILAVSPTCWLLRLCLGKLYTILSFGFSDIKAAASMLTFVESWLSRPMLARYTSVDILSIHPLSKLTMLGLGKRYSAPATLKRTKT